MGNFLEIDTAALLHKVAPEQEWVLDGHLARFVLEVVLQMDLAAFVFRGNKASYF